MKTVFQWVIVFIAVVCSLIIAKSYLESDRQIQVQRANQTVYDAPMPVRQEMPQRSLSEVVERPEIYRVDDGGVTNEISPQEIR